MNETAILFYNYLSIYKKLLFFSVYNSTTFFVNLWGDGNMISYAHLNSKEVFCANLVWLPHLAGYQKNWTWFLVLSVAVWFADWNLYNIKANFLQPLSVLKISFFFKQAYFRQYVMDTLESWYWPHLGCSVSPFINSMTGAELIKFFSLVFKSYVNNKIYLHVVVY